MTYFPLHDGLKKRCLPSSLRNTCQNLIIGTSTIKG
ncbi:unnamed protein product [Prunus brigantina]